MKLLSRVIFVLVAGIVVTLPFAVVINQFLHRLFRFSPGGQSIADVLLAIAAMLVGCFLTSAALIIIIFAGAIVYRLVSPAQGRDLVDLLTQQAGRLALSIAAENKLRELSEIDKQVKQRLAEMKDRSYTKAYVLRGLGEKLCSFVYFFSDQCGDMAKAVSSLPDPSRSLYRSLPVMGEILFEDVNYHEGYYLGTTEEHRIVAFDEQVSSAMERMLSLLAKQEYEFGFEQVENSWGKALLHMHNWQAETDRKANPKTRVHFQSLIVGFLEKKMSVTDFIAEWENSTWDPNDLADIGYFVAFVRRFLRHHTTSSDRAPFAAALSSFRELYAKSPELQEALPSEMWTKKITPHALGMIAMVHQGGRVSKNERRQ